MDWEIGEIRQINDEWYQCLEDTNNGRDCNNYCDLYNAVNDCQIACTSGERVDNKEVYFKKLEKVGKPYNDCGTILQRFKIYTNVTNADTKGLELHIYSNDTIGIEIKQIKEDIKEDMEEKKLNLKPFDIQKAKEGKPVCTKDGRKARIICFDRNDFYPIVALIECKNGKEMIGAYSKDGHTDIYEIKGTDLMMLPEKKEGWVNVYKHFIYKTKEEAQSNINPDNELIDTIKMSWEE